MTERPVLGIDLGTTYSCVARLDEFAKPVALINDEGDYTTPSVVYFEDQANVVVGKQAKNELHRDPDRVVQHIKRHMGEPDFCLEIDGRDFYPQQISGVILRTLVEGALEAIDVEPAPGEPLADVVITVPAYFGGAEREATRKAGELAGLNVVSIINEPTAAAVAYGLVKSGPPSTVLVYDLGGGTFDVTIIAISPDEIRAVATGGDRQLGGADWDKRLVSLFAEKFTEQCPDGGDLLDDQEVYGDLVLQAEQAKQGLTKRNKYGLSITANTQRAQFDVTREEFEKVTEDLVERTLTYTELVLDAAAEKNVTRIDEVILVGGMSRVPVIATVLAERLRRRFPGLPDPKLTDPDQIVAKGAALYASSRIAEQYESDPARRPDENSPGSEKWLPGPALPSIVNIASRGYGIKTVRDERDQVGLVSWMIKPNDPIPADIKDQFKTVHRDQTEVDIVVFESGTDILSEDLAANVELVQATLTGLPARQPAGQPLDVTFTLGDEGILRVRAWASNGREVNIEHKIAGSMPDEESAKPLPTITR